MKKLDKLRAILEKYNIKKAEVFGSVARGEARSGSDLDLLVEFPKGVSLFEIGRLQYELEHLLGVKVDLVNRKTVKPILKPYIMRDLIRII